MLSAGGALQRLHSEYKASPCFFQYNDRMISYTPFALVRTNWILMLKFRGFKVQSKRAVGGRGISGRSNELIWSHEGELEGGDGRAIRRKQNRVRRDRQHTCFVVCSYSRACTPYFQHSHITHPGEGRARTHVGIQTETSRSNKKTEQCSLA